MTKPLFTVFLAALSLPLASIGQSTAPVQPQTSIGFQLPRFAGDWSYALSASQTVVTGYNGNGGTVSATNIAGDFAYASPSPKHPTALVYSGGFLGSESSQQPSSTFQELAISQQLIGEHWNLMASDTVSYLPESPVGGLSGIPGVGDLGTAPITVGLVSGPGILTNYDTRVGNVVGLTGQRSLTGKTSINASGNYAIQRFLNNNGVDYSDYDNNELEAGGGVNHRFDERHSIGVNYIYSRFTYVSEPFSFTSNGVNVEYMYQWTRKLALDVSLGPQFSSGTEFGSSAISLAVLSSLTYSGERSSASLSYTRGTNAGSGVVQGALSDSVGFNAQRMLTRKWSGSVFASYSHSQSLPTLLFPPFNVQSEVAGGQLTRGLGRSFSAYASYTLEHQSSAGANLSSLAFNGLQQIFGFGVTYSPATHHLGRR